jgi:hypothetical protein
MQYLFLTSLACRWDGSMLREVTAKNANEKLAHRRLAVVEVAERLGNVAEAARHRCRDPARCAEPNQQSRRGASGVTEVGRCVWSRPGASSRRWRLALSAEAHRTGANGLSRLASCRHPVSTQNRDEVGSGPGRKQGRDSHKSGVRWWSCALHPRAAVMLGCEPFQLDVGWVSSGDAVAAPFVRSPAKPVRRTRFLEHESPAR